MDKENYIAQLETALVNAERTSDSAQAMLAMVLLTVGDVTIPSAVKDQIRSGGDLTIGVQTSEDDSVRIYIDRP